MYLIDINVGLVKLCYYSSNPNYRNDLCSL